MAERAKIESRMAELREYAKQALPSGATEEQVRAELDGNPRKYPGWRELVAAMESNIAEEQGNKAMAQTALRRRILREESKRRAQGAAPEAK